ncbi:nuclear transport factor 2 family protein [Croceicoccus marinus]|uniref:SnoaL-like domain-containing protein n=1 Tax=Croceicoccus marinus TaxID=450378 RepID=A0A1Z1FGU2_9SPHN|nr:nuclear transport factor 2 family protein [Croceicoccus marinus]ARU17940.1 hypothetical protein A9D14_16620 [Croceicoccus marinus]
MTPQQMSTFIDELYAASGSGDWDKVASMVTDDLVISEAPGLPMEGTHTGKDALKNLYLDVFAMLQVESLEMVERTFGGDHACCILKMHYGKGLEPAELVEMFRFEGGKVAEIKPFYYDPAPVRAAAAAFSGS